MDITKLFLEKIETAGLWEKEIELKRNDFLLNAGKTDSNIYFITQGCIRIFVYDQEEEHTIRFGYTNSVITAMDSYITETPSDFYMQALRKTQLRFISKQNFNTLLDDNIENLKLWNQLLYGLVYQQMERERDLLTSFPQERYNRVLKRSPQLFQEVPSKYIASYLRMTPETLSRLKKS